MLPVRGDGEDVKRALKRLLDSPALLSAVTAIVIEKGDGIWPVYPWTVFAEERLSNNVFPSAEIILYRTQYTGEIVKSALHIIGIRWTAVSYDEETVTKMVERLVRATSEVVWNSTLDMLTSSGPITVTDEDYSPLVPIPNLPYVKSGLVMLEVPTWR